MTAYPHVTVHYAQSIDGRIATRTGDSRWLSSEASLELAHELRAAHDAVLVGVGTVVADNPQLTVRRVSGTSPVRVVVDSTLRLPMNSNLLSDSESETIVATTARASEERAAILKGKGVQVLVVREDEEGRVELDEVFSALGSRGVESVLVEGGRELITSILRRRLADRLVVCIAPRIIGSGIDAVGDLGVGILNEAVSFNEVTFKQIGEDIIFDGYVEKSAERDGSA